MPVAGSCPGNTVDGLAQGQHLRPVPGAFALKSDRIGHVGDGLQGQHVPQVLQQTHIAVVAPVSPVPVAVVPFHQSVLADMIGGQVLLDDRIGIPDGLQVAGVHVIVPDAVAAHGGQHLARQFHPVIAGDGREEDVVRTLPVAEFANSLADQGVQGRGIGVETFPQDGHDVSPPLSPLPVRAVEEGVAGIDIDRPQPLLPQAVVEEIRTVESAVRRGVIPGFPVFQGRHPDTMVHRQDDPLSAEPAQGFILLRTCLGDIFRAQAFFPHPGMVRLDDDPMPALSIFHRQHGRHLHVVRQQGDQGVGLGAGTGFEGDGLDSEVLPLRDGTGMQDAQRIVQGNRRDKALQRTRLPIPQVLPGIEGDAGLGQPVIGGGKIHGRPIGGMDPAHPGGIPECRRIKPHLRLSAAQVRESVLAEVPEQQGHLVVSLPEIRGQVHLIEIAVLRIGSAFQSAFKHHKPAVHPEPVLAVHRNPGRNRFRNRVQPDVLPESDPLVRCIRRTGAAQGPVDLDDDLFRRFPQGSRFLGNRCLPAAGCQRHQRGKNKGESTIHGTTGMQEGCTRRCRGPSDPLRHIPRQNCPRSQSPAGGNRLPS